MKQYLDFARYILENGEQTIDRTGVGTIGITGGQLRFDLREGFPLMTTKKTPLRLILEELFWMRDGRTDVGHLQERNVHIWDEWATKEQCAKFNRTKGDLGPVYGWAWRKFGAKPSIMHVYDEDGILRQGPGYDTYTGVDQLANLVKSLRENPSSRRHIVTGWHPLYADQVALPPCHTLFQCFVKNGYLDLHLYQRSADMFLGVPFNITSYATLLMMLAQVSDLTPRYFIHSFGDAHIYLNHIEQVKLQLSRDPKPLPRMILNPEVKDLFAFKYEDFKLEGYESHPAIKAQIAV
jgi:thymidylate synthase